MDEASSSSDYPALSGEAKEDYSLLEEVGSYHEDEDGGTYHPLQVQNNMGTRRYNVDVQMMDHNKDDNMYYQGQDSMHGVDNKNDDHPRHQVILDQERFLPIANVARIMKKVIPDSGKLAKEAKECVQECVSEFISFLTSEASDKCLAEKRRTITADDLLDALSSTGLVKYVEPVKALLNRHKASNKFTNTNGTPTSRVSFSEYQEQPSTSRPQAPITNTAQMVTVIPAGSNPFSNSGPSYAFVMQPGPSSGSAQVVTASNFNGNAESVFTSTSQTVPIVHESSHNSNSFSTSRPNITHRIDSSNDVPTVVYQDTMILDSGVAGDSQQFQIITQQGPIYATGEDGTAVTLVPGGEVLNGEEAPSNQGPVVQTQNMQIYVDPTTKQHYVAVETPDGPPHLFPITIKDEPVTMSIAENGLPSGSTSFVVQTATPQKHHEQTEHSDNSNDGPPVLEAMIESRQVRNEHEHVRRSELVRSAPYTIPSKK